MLHHIWGGHVWREGERHERGNGGIEETRTNPVVGLNTCLQSGTEDMTHRY